MQKRCKLFFHQFSHSILVIFQLFLFKL